MSRGVAVRLAVTFAVLLALHFSLRPALGWRVSVDFVVVAILMLAVRVRPGVAALAGFFLGLLVDVQHPPTLGASALGLACVAFGASFLKASFFSDKPSMNALLFFLGKWAFDVLFVLIATGIAAQGVLSQLFIWSPLSAALTAVAGTIVLLLAGPMLREARV